MSSRRTMILLGAIAAGVIAALLLFQYIRGIEEEAFDRAKRVEVYIAVGQVKRSTPGSEAIVADIAPAQIPQQFRPETAITTTAEIAPKVALFDISPGTVIVQGMFVDPVTTQISFRQRLKNQKHVAISVSTDTTRGVAGLIVPTDEVNLMVFEELGELQNEEGAANGGGGAATQAQLQEPAPDAEGQRGTAVFKSRARLLYQRVQVLAVGQQARLEPGETVDPEAAPNNVAANTITFSVPAEAALWIATAQQTGGLYMTLVGEEYVAEEVTRLPLTFDRLPGETAEVLTPDGPTGAPR